jgi:hypothetical protein
MPFLPLYLLLDDLPKLKNLEQRVYPMRANVAKLAPRTSYLSFVYV